MKKRRSFTPEQRLLILHEAQREGQSVTIRKYNIAHSLFDRWKKKYLKEGMVGLHNSYNKIDPVVRELEIKATFSAFK